MCIRDRYNVARGLRRCFGLHTAVVTALADNEVGRLIEDFILQGGVDVDNVADGIKAGAVAVGAGSSLTAGAKTGDYQRITETGRRFVENIRQARAQLDADNERQNRYADEDELADAGFDYVADEEVDASYDDEGDEF